MVTNSTFYSKERMILIFLYDTFLLRNMASVTSRKPMHMELEMIIYPMMTTTGMVRRDRMDFLDSTCTSKTQYDYGSSHRCRSFEQ